MLRAEKGGGPDGGRDGRNGLVAWVCRVRHVPGEKVEGGKQVSSGRAVEAVGMEACLSRQSTTGTREENRVNIAVQLGLRVEDGRGGHYTEGEGCGSIK